MQPIHRRRLRKALVSDHFPSPGTADRLALPEMRPWQRALDGDVPMPTSTTVEVHVTDPQSFPAFLAELEAKVAKITPGPWCADGATLCTLDEGFLGREEDIVAEDIVREEDALGIVALVNGFPRLREEIQRLTTGYRCSNCHGPYRYDVSIPSPTWNKVIRQDGHETDNETRCASCIIEAFAIAGVSFEGELYGDTVNLPGTKARRIRVVVDDIELDDSYGSLEANIRTLTRERDQAREALRTLSFTRSDGSICHDGPRCTADSDGGEYHGTWRHSPQCIMARRALGERGVPELEVPE